MDDIIGIQNSHGYTNIEMANNDSENINKKKW